MLERVTFQDVLISHIYIKRLSIHKSVEYLPAF